MSITDFFVQVLNGDFNTGSNPLQPGNLALAGDYNWTQPGQWALPTTGRGILFDPIPDGQTMYPMGSGALVQKWPQVALQVSNTLDVALDYDFWKSFAIANNGYVRPSQNGSGFVNEKGQTLYVTSTGMLTTVASGN